VRCMLHVRLPTDREREDAGVDREEIKQRKHAVLVKQKETDEHERARKQVCDIGVEGIHRDTLETNSSIVPRSPSISATPRNSGTRNTRIFAIAVSNTTSRKPSTVSLTA